MKVHLSRWLSPCVAALLLVGCDKEPDATVQPPSPPAAETSSKPIPEEKAMEVQNAQVSAAPEGFAAAVFVAPQGDDLNPGTREKPFATLERARDAIRPLIPGMGGDLLVEVAPGDYWLSETFVLGPEDSGANGHRVLYRGAGEPGSARLIGGQKISDWVQLDEHRFRAKLSPGMAINTLYENGLRARKARFPNYEYDSRFPLADAPYLNTEAGTSHSLKWKEGDLNAISGVPLDGANVVVWPWGLSAWHKTPRRIMGVDIGTRTISIDDMKTGIGEHARFYIEGALGLLDAPGEFYFDPGAGEITYWPRFGDPKTQEIIAPALDRIISLEGKDVDNPVHDICIEGFAIVATNTFPFMKSTTLFPWAETADGAFGTVQLRYTSDVEIVKNHIKDSGTNGIYLAQSNKRVRIADNWIEDCGISGIVLAYHRKARQLPRDINEENLIENNLIEKLGSIAVDSAGINIWGGRRNIVRHCEIRDGARYGVSIRGPYTQLRPGDGQADMGHTNRPIAEGNLITLSRFSRLAQDSGDTGAVHMAGISSRSNHPVNTLEQLIIEDIGAHPSMKDCPPNGIFFDYTEGVTDQVLRDIEIAGTPNPFRTNRTDFRHTYENVSWKEGFDSSRMRRDQIGLQAGFPRNFGGPPEVINPLVTESPEKAGMLDIRWTNPETENLAGTWITLEGQGSQPPVFVPVGQSTVAISKPVSGQFGRIRIQAEDHSGNRSDGVLIPAAEIPPPLENLVVTGQSDSIDLKWDFPAEKNRGFRVVTMVPGIAPVEVPAGTTAGTVRGLKDGQAVSLRIDIVDAAGHVWPGREVRAVAGKGVPIPTDEAAAWTLDDTQLAEGLSIGDQSGNGNTLFVTGTGIRSTDGIRDGAFEVDGRSGYLRLLDNTRLGIGTGDYTISLWIKRTPSPAMAGRILDFGGGTRGEWEHWGQSAGELSQGGVSLLSDDKSVAALFHDGSKLYQVRAEGLTLVDQWHHLAVTVDRDQAMTLWVNGERADSTRIAESKDKDISAAEAFLIARSSALDHSNLQWSGAVDQIRVYRRTLSPDEIIALAKEGRESPSQPRQGRSAGR